jgi:hypothetical protein
MQTIAEILASSGAGEATMTLTQPQLPLPPALDKDLPLAQPPSDPLAQEMMRLFGQAFSYKARYVPEMLEAYYAAQNEYAPDVKCKLTDPAEREFYAGLFSRQLSIYMSWVLDRISQTDKFFTLEPTPIPSVPDRYKLKAVTRVMEELKKLDYLPTDVALEYAKERLVDLKEAINHILYQDATRAMVGMEKAMNDVIAEGDFRTAYMQFHHDLFCSIGVMKFPAVEFETRVKWNGDNLTTVNEPVLKFRRVSPFDFYWSPDSTNSQDGAYIIERMRMPYEALKWMNDKSKGVIESTTEYLLETFKTGKPWIENHFANQNEAELAAQIGRIDGSTTLIPGMFDVLAFHTRINGERLIAYDLDYYVTEGKTKQIDPEQMYAVEVWVVQGYTAYVSINAHPTGRRPYDVASYEPVAGQLYGTSAWKKLKPWEMAFRSGHRNLLRATAFEAGVIAEIDSGRFANYQSPKQLKPWMSYSVDADYTGGGQTAVRFLKPQTNTANLRVYLADIEQQAQSATGIFNTMGGSTAYGTVARTRFGVESVQSNATKIIFAKSEYVDKYAIEPLLRSLYTYLMLFSDDNTIKADAQVVLKGMTSVSARDGQKQLALQLLQYLPAMMQIDQQKGTNAVPPSMIQALFRTIVEGLGGDTDDMPDPQAVSSVAQAIGLSPRGEPGGSPQFQQTQQALDSQMPSQGIQTPPQP